ncbi:hypothetical protein MMC12_002032 [Toensbergia leucococca]|nr:hypothetical protein [Toensbergia leucococca]
MASIQEEEERIKMPLFWLGLAAVGLGFGTIAIVAFLFPVVDISPVDGRCRIGLPLKVTIPLLSYDIVLNFGLCGVFFRTCQKHTGTTRTRGLWQRVFSDLPFVHPTLIASTPPLRLEILAYRCLMGACAIVIPTTANLVILFRIHGREQGWLCFTICTIDITWQAIIIHWVSSDIETPADVHAARELAQAEENRLRRFERHVKKEEHRARQQQDRPPQDRQSRSGHHHHSSPPPSPSSSRSGFQPQRLHGGRGTGEEGIELIPMNRS